MSEKRGRRGLQGLNLPKKIKSGSRGDRHLGQGVGKEAGSKKAPLKTGQRKKIAAGGKRGVSTGGWVRTVKKEPRH